ncbi:unnamed protein product [Toxocara canis]|uniref:DUF2235 domain-containing protein n=1 Tax=Toxocara canis TaxID=6265 RepID=A0A183USZ2_TOXCA|nr:unnamed protein product [Toxocara canis]
MIADEGINVGLSGFITSRESRQKKFFNDYLRLERNQMLSLSAGEALYSTPVMALTPDGYKGQNSSTYYHVALIIGDALVRDAPLALDVYVVGRDSGSIVSELVRSTIGVACNKGTIFHPHSSFGNFFLNRRPNHIRKCVEFKMLTAFLVDVKWSATVKGRPSLPLWLHLMPSQHKMIAYLYGTPVTPAMQIVIHVIARRIDNFETAQHTVQLVDTADCRVTSEELRRRRVH